MKISGKLTAGFAAVIATVLVCSATLLIAGENAARLGKLSDRIDDARSQASQANLMQVRQKAESRGFLIHPESAAKSRFEKAGNEFRDVIGRLRQDLAGADPALLQDLIRYQTVHDAWEDQVGVASVHLGQAPETLEEGRALAVSTRANTLNDACRDQAGL